MRFLLVLAFLGGFASGQTFTARPNMFETDAVAVTFDYSVDPEFVAETCYWHIYLASKPINKPVIFEGCKSIHYAFPNGDHKVELVVNGRQKRYAHLSIEQRHIVKALTVRPRAVLE